METKINNMSSALLLFDNLLCKSPDKIVNITYNKFVVEPFYSSSLYRYIMKVIDPSDQCICFISSEMVLNTNLYNLNIGI